MVAMYHRRNAQNTAALQSASCFVLIVHQIEPRGGKRFFSSCAARVRYRPILRALNRIRVELVGEFLLAIR